jgi:sugar phosphate isomerase/epimerase
MPEHPIGCALWSLGLPTTVAAVEAAAGLGFRRAQLFFRREEELAPSGLAAIAEALRRTGLEAVGGTIGFPGEDWSSIDAIRRTGGYVPAEVLSERLELTRRWAAGYAELGLGHVTTHAGFIPARGEPGRDAALGRLASAAEAVRAAGLTLGLETGQESAAELANALDDLAFGDLSVNLDPANLVLYGSDEPVSAAARLVDRVTLVHAKDAVASAAPGRVWGRDVPLGTGEVDWPGVLAALEAGGYAGPIVLEREAGDDRPGDLVAGRAYLERLLGGPPAGPAGV